MKIGSGQPRTVELLDAEELRTVLGNEAAHILSDHVLYHTALMILLSASGLGRLPVLAGLPLLAVRMALRSGSAPPSRPATARRRWSTATRWSPAAH